MLAAEMIIEGRDLNYSVRCDIFGFRVNLESLKLNGQYQLRVSDRSGEDHVVFFPKQATEAEVDNFVYLRARRISVQADKKLGCDWVKDYTSRNSHVMV